MKLLQDIDDSKAMRKSLKPLVERRRRERINNSLESLKSLLFQQQEATRRRVEKAEILKHTVLFLQKTTRDKTRGAGGDQRQSYQDGYSACLQRAAQFLGPEGKGLWLGAALDASFASRFSRSDSDPAGVHSRVGAQSCSRAILQSLMDRSGHRLCSPPLTVTSCVQTGEESQRSPSAPRQPHNAASRASKQRPVQSHQAGQSVWRPWP